MNGTTGSCDPAIIRLAKETGLQEHCVKQAIRELEASGWWQVSRSEGDAIEFLAKYPHPIAIKGARP